MKDKIKMYKELAFVYIVKGKKFLDKKEAEQYLEKLNKED
jgi:hypothetical protein|tara:strand:- start:1691 stop:1810 length:120 start_codon:yes stop_codon:yes gene_type:complete